MNGVNVLPLLNSHTYYSRQEKAKLPGLVIEFYDQSFRNASNQVTVLKQQISIVEVVQ